MKNYWYTYGSYVTVLFILACLLIPAWWNSLSQIAQVILVINSSIALGLGLSLGFLLIDWSDRNWSLSLLMLGIGIILGLVLSAASALINYWVFSWNIGWRFGLLSMFIYESFFYLSALIKTTQQYERIQI